MDLPERGSPPMTGLSPTILNWTGVGIGCAGGGLGGSITAHRCPLRPFDDQERRNVSVVPEAADVDELDLRHV